MNPDSFSAVLAIERHVASLKPARDAIVAAQRVNVTRPSGAVPNAQTLARQIGAIRTIANYTYGRGESETARITNAIAEWLAARGVHSVMDIGYARGNSDRRESFLVFGSGDGGGDDSASICFHDDFFFDRTTGVDLSFNLPTDCARPLPLLCEIDLGSGDLLRVFLAMTADGFPLFYGIIVDTGPESWGGAFWHDFRGALVTMGPLIGIALAIFIPGAGVAIGSAIVGAGTAAAYPLLTAAIGNAVLTACLNGGNIEAAVIGAAAGFVGAYAGTAVKAATDSGALAVAAQSATVAMIRGGDVETTVAQALIGEGFKSMESYFSEPDPVTLPDVDPGYDPSFTFDFPPALTFGDTSMLSFDFSSDIGTGLDWGFGDWSFTPNPAPAVVDPVARPTANPSPVSGGTTGWDVAMQALKMLPIFTGKTVPTVATAPRTVTGAVDPRALAVGQPATTPDGRVIVNNGNGTYTSIDSAGRATTLPMPGSSAGIGSMLGGMSPLTLAAIGAGIFLLARRR